MAYTQLALYNEALRLAGEGKLSDLTDDIESRCVLDDVYTVDAVDFCLELAKPSFSRKTDNLTGPAAGSTFSYSHSLPSDYVTIVGVFSDAGLSQPIDRYVIENTSILCDVDDIYLRFVSNGRDIGDWDPSFGKFTAAYLAREIATRLTKEEREQLDATYKERLEVAQGMAEEREPKGRPKDSSTSLTNDWLPIYNDALLILGLEEIVTTDDDSNRRQKLSRALSAGVVSALLEDVSWQFGFTTEELDYDNSLEPVFGYTKVIAKPAKLHRLDGLFQDEYCKVPLKLYADEGDYWYCDLETIYVKFISTDFLTDPSQWPTYFKRIVAAAMAQNAGLSLRGEGADLENAKAEFRDREKSGKSIDAMQSPPQVIKQGSWTGDRWGRRDGNRNRP